MEKFRICSNVGYTIDRNGVIVIKNNEQSHCIRYPQAAIWLLMTQNNELPRVEKQIKAVLRGIEDSPMEFTTHWLNIWKNAGLIE